MATVAAINNLGAYAHNPRGNLWFNDDSTYGHKLLMKMGWSKGKGLGKNEDGIKENLSVKFRNTNSGLGYKDDSYANVMATDYESILKSLATEHSQNGTCVNKNKGHEQKSRIVKGRLRYPKLFFGKDVSKYSEQDMKSIFICSQPFKDNEQENLEITASSQRQESRSELSEDTETYSSKLSISDYFAKKMTEKKNNLLSREACNDLSQQQASLNSETAEKDILTFVPHKKIAKKGKKASEININDKSTIDLHQQQASLELEGAITENLTASTNRSSRKKRKKTSEISINGIEIALHADANVHESIVPSKKKQKLSGDLVYKDDVSAMIMDETSCTSSKKRKKSQRYENGDSSIDAIGDNTFGDKIFCQIELSNSSLHLNKSKKKCHKNKDRCISSNIVEFPLGNLISEKYEKLENSLANDHSTPRSVEEGLSKDDVNYSKKKKCKSKNSCTSNTIELPPENPQVTKDYLSLTSVEEKLSNNDVNFSKKKKCYKNKDRCSSADTAGYLLENSQVKTDHCSSTSEEKALVNNGKSSKKKKCHRNKYRFADTVELPLENVVPVKGENVLKNFQMTNDHSSLVCAEGNLLNNDVSYSKLKKKMKLKKLRSCLKSKSGTYSIKSVSFNQNVSYRVIDTDYESVDYLSDVQSVVQNESTNEVFDVDYSESDSSDNTSVNQVVSSGEQKCDGDSCTKKQEKISGEESEEDCLLSSLPSTKSSHYNYWIESQRQALKMKLYKSMLRSIKKHKVLNTTNMLSIKGYGNWGFN